MMSLDAYGCRQDKARNPLANFMRAQLLIAILLIFSATLAGCAGEDIEEEITVDLDEAGESTPDDLSLIHI